MSGDVRRVWILEISIPRSRSNYLRERLDGELGINFCLVTVINSSDFLVISPCRGDDLGNGIPSNGCPNCIRHVRRRAAGRSPDVEGFVDFDLGLARREAYVGKLEG